MPTLNPMRIIEIGTLGKFYVIGKPSYVVMEAPNVDPARSGYIITEECFQYDPSFVADIQTINCVYKLGPNNDVIARLLVKNKDMADEICYACNRIKT